MRGVHLLSASPPVPLLPPYAAAWWHVDTERESGTWNRWWRSELHINKTEGFVCSVLQNAHACCCFTARKRSRVDRFTDFTQLLRKPSIDHRGYPFQKDFAFTPERMTSKVGHGVLKNFIFDRQPGDVSRKMSLMTCLSGYGCSWLFEAQPMQGRKSSHVSHSCLQCVMKMPIQTSWSWSFRRQQRPDYMLSTHILGIVERTDFA